MRSSKIYCIFFSFLVAVLAVCACLIGVTSGVNAYAADTADPFDNTYVVDDLKAAEFVLENYPKDPSGDMQAMYFVEYGYNVRVNEQSDYALYVYVYNPAEINVDVAGKNFVQISSERAADGSPVDYSKYSLKCVSKSSGVYGNLFYKFKVVAGLNEQLAYLNADIRRYDVSGIEIQTVGSSTATEYPISTTFYFSGYAKGYGLDKEGESTLTCRSESLETIGLDVKHTTYKYQNAKNGGQEIASVYFNVPDNYFTDYGGLQRIKAEWIRALTKDVLVTTDSDFYNRLRPYIGQDIGLYQTNIDIGLLMYDNDSYYTGNSSPEGFDEFYMPWACNVLNSDFGNPRVGERMRELQWLFYKEGASAKDVTVSSEEILAFYNTSVDKEALFLELDRSKTVKEIDAGDAFSLEGFDKNANLINWLTKLLYPDIQTSDIAGISPIKVLTSTDVAGTDEEVATRLYVDKSDVQDIKNSVSQKGSKTVLFRFAVGEYVTKSVVFRDRNTGNGSGDALYRNRLPMYLDFDIIWLGFQKGEKLTVIPAVSSPINISGGTIAPPKDVVEKAEDWFKDLWDKMKNTKDKLLEVLKWVGIAIGAIIVIIVLCAVIKGIVKLCKSIRKSSNNSKAKKK